METPILLLLLFIIYLIIITSLKSMGFRGKNECNYCSNCCPKCRKPLERIRRNNFDRTINIITFQIFKLNRYKCINCDWEGLLSENKFDKKH